MNTNKLIIGILIAVMIVALGYFALTDYLGLGYTTPGEDTEALTGDDEETNVVRQVLPPEIYLNSLAGSERIQSGGTKVLSGNINLTFKFLEPVNIEAENGFSVEADGVKIERLSIGYGGVDRKTVILNIPPSGNEEETLRIMIGRHVFFDENTELRDYAVFYIKRYSSNKVDIKQIGPDGLQMEPEAWITEGTKAFKLVFDRSVNKASVERAIKMNVSENFETQAPEIRFEWNGEREADVIFANLESGTYEINITGAEDEIGLVMQGDFGVGNCWRFNVAKSQRIKTYDMASGAIETIEGKAFEEVRYLSGRIDGENIMLHKFASAETDSEAPMIFEKMRYDEATGEAVPVESGGELKGYYEQMLDKGWKFRGIKISPDGKTAAAFISSTEIGPEGRIARLLLIDVETETIHGDIEMPFYIYAAGDGVFPMDIHFDWTGESIIFAEGFTMLGNTSNIYGINTKTGTVVALKKNAREPRFVPELKMLTAIEMKKTEEGIIRRDGEEEQKINYYSDSAVILMGVYGNELKEYKAIEGYTPYIYAMECEDYDSIGSIVWSHENKLVYPEKIKDNSILLVQDLGNAKAKRVDMEMNFIFLGIKDGKAYVLEETK
ncbi:MAG: hypothetical protein JJE29_05975 [Peptostreptococcaceae bacterium]|nr:hypothetical protein [Peptostreptococcaceae bacterium]